MTAPSEYAELVRGLRDAEAWGDRQAGATADAIEALQKRVGELEKDWGNAVEQTADEYEKRCKTEAERDALARLLREVRDRVPILSDRLRAAIDAAREGEKP